MIEMTSKEIENFNFQSDSKWKFWKKKRIIVTILLFIGFLFLYLLRVNVSLAIVAMTQTQSVVNDDGIIVQKQLFPWTSQEKGSILSAFFYGYLATQILGGYLSTKFPCNIIFGISIGGSALLTAITPFAVKFGIHGFIIIRIFIGILEGVTFPAIFALIARWSLPTERTRMFSISFAGSQIGTIIAMPMCASLANTFGWESIFYVPGILGIIWTIFFFIIVAESPEKDKWISKDELKLIVESRQIKSFKDIKHPWKSFFTSSCVLAAFFAHFCENWGYFTFLTQLPMYLSDVFKIDLVNIGFFASAPYLAMALVLVISSCFGDFLLERKLMSATNMRKGFTCLSFMVQATFICLTANISNVMLCVIFLTISIGFAGFGYSGFLIVYQDVAPQHSSILMGISNTFAAIPGIISPVLTGVIVQDGVASQWKIVFYISCGIYLTGTIITAIWSKSELQPWAKQISENDSNKGNNSSELN